jgi:hypothetical protein
MGMEAGEAVGHVRGKDIGGAATAVARERGGPTLALTRAVSVCP